MSRPVFRFAPSPNGLLHLGHAYSALLNFELARRNGGRFLLRIEDIDTTRSRPEFEAAIYEDLAWLGIVWEEPVRRQSEHFAAYETAVRRLDDLGLVYPAFMSRSEIAVATQNPSWPRDPDGAPLYPGSDRDLADDVRRALIAEGKPYAVRLRTPEAVAKTGPLTFDAFPPEDIASLRSVAADPRSWGDVLIARREIPTSYHLSVVIDDALQGVTHVVRGADLLAATAVHRLLQTLMGLPAPAYHHHRLVLGDDGRKLSKSEGDRSLASLRSGGAEPADIRRMVGIDADLAAIASGTAAS